MYETEAIQTCAGKIITNLTISDGESELLIRLDNGKTLSILDDQQCCENRYMMTDDDLQYYVGAEFLGAALESSSKSEEEDSFGDVHEEQFLLIHTSKGTFTIVTHNEHNGYYGGFNIECSISETEVQNDK
jgi:hypothetical protein